MIDRLASRAVESVVAVLVVSLLTAHPAHAYLDPGSGSYALQVGIAGVLGAIFSLKMFWKNLRERLGGAARHAGESAANAANAATATHAAPAVTAEQGR